MNKIKRILPIIVVILLFTPSYVFTIDEREQAIITKLGEFRRVVVEPGLHFKQPFVEKITRFEKRMLWN